MHLPVGPRPGAGDRARPDRFRLRRGLAPEDGPAYAAARLAALQHAQDPPDPGPAWRPLGPFAVPHGHTAGSGPGSRPPVTGRVAAVAVDPGDPRHLLAGGGGAWESRDGGQTWTPRADDQPTTAVGALAFAPGDPAIAYAGTGQGEALAALGVGLLRSDDGGASWRALVSRELLGTGVHDLLVDPGDAGRVLAATTAGLWASADGGRGWTQRLAGRCWSVAAGAGGELLAGGEFGLHRSEDGGAGWRRVPLAAAPAAFERVAVAVAPGGQVGYVFAAGDGVGHLWRREHAGGVFEPVKPPADLHSQRAWHTFACAADPGDPDVVWLGAAGLHRGARGPDGRWSWVDLTARPAGDSLPLGQHAVVAGPGDPGVLYVAGEGGLFRSSDGGRSWRSLGIGLAVAEVGALADHGPWLLAGAGELGAVRYEGGEVWCPLGPGDPAVAAGGELVAAGAGGLVVSADGGATWTVVDLPGVRGAVTALAAAGPDRLLGGTAEGELLLLERDGGRWAVRETARPRAGWVAGVAVDPGRPEVAWAAWSDPRGGRVWRSEDGGATWADRSGDLPEVAAGAVVPDPGRPGTVFAATDAGVWRSDDDGAAWRPLGRGLPNAPVLALALRGPERLLRAGLLGRGVWELPLDAPAPTTATPALRSTRSPAAHPRPGGPWWECPDIKVEAPPRPREDPLSPVEFEDDRWPDAAGPPDLGGRVAPGYPARVHVQVHHRGDGPLRDVRVRVLAAPACLHPPAVPPGDWLWTGGPPPGSPWRPVGPPTPLGDLAPGRSAVASLDWQVPLDLPRDICLLAVAISVGSAVSGRVVDSRSHLTPPAVTLPVGAPQTGGWGSGTPSVAGDPGAPVDASDPTDPPRPTDPADLVAADGRWGCKSVTVLEAGRGRVLRLELRGDESGGPFALAAEGWVAELTGGLVLPRGLAGLARGAGLGAGRVPEGWRAGLVQLVREEPALAERLDLGAVVPVAGGRRDPGLEVWLEGMELDPDRAEPFLVLLREPPAAGRGCLLLLDSGGGVVGGHTLQVAR
ncbi:MAG TPA: hypothetical protein VF468_22070 [Actinomycetota bacterium]|nr:hypothetical protein [Actinomycetota bacterium]